MPLFATLRPAIVAACVALGGVAACTPTDPPPTPTQIIAAGNGLTWYRGNLHTHTLWSDGQALPDTVVAWYRGNGYQFLALSEHDLLPEGDRWIAVDQLPAGAHTALPQVYADGDGLREQDGRREVRLRRQDELEARYAQPGQFLLLQAEEISDNVGPVSIHVNAVNLPTRVSPARGSDVNGTIEADFDAAASAGRAAGQDVLLQLNHPNFTHSVTAEQLMDLRGSPFFEVYNGHPLSDNLNDGLRPSVERMWDIALAWRLDVLGLPPLYATATDDSHSDPAGGDAPPGRGWIMVLADALEPASLFGAMREGRFYASTGVRLRRIVATGDRMEVEVDAEPGIDYRIEFIGTRSRFDVASAPATSATGRPLYASRRHHDAIGEVFAEHAATRAVYRFQADDLYVRARVTASRRHPRPSQPLQFEQAWVQPLVGPAGREPGRRGLAAPESADVSLHWGVTRRMQPMVPGEADALLGARARGAGCALDALGDGTGRATTTFRSGDSALFSGWIGNPARGEAADWLAVVLQGASGSYLGEGAPTRARPDVAQAFGKPSMEASGYTLGFELANVEPGEYRIRLVGYRKGRAEACDSGKALKVR
ncbi:hypothetical protein [Luteimonas saliphila]|uniref:hypothetical protein n=1 Tax=Luteimonas saliphila TaxID=2804919 RepID=UPI00192E17F6|nr:hypothetical protein [Luteimonas saliphila]